MLVDLSLTGCLLRSEEPVAQDSIHDLELVLPGGALQAKARAAASSRDGADQAFLVGFEFIQMPASGEARLRAFLDAEARRCEPAR